MRTLSIFVWLVFLAFTVFWIIRYIKTNKHLIYRQNIDVVITSEDKKYYNEIRNTAFGVFIIFFITTVVDAVIIIF